MSNTNTATQDELNHLVVEARKLVDDKNVNSSEVKEQLEKMDEQFTKQEAKNQELTKNLMKSEDMIKDLERQVYLMPNAANDESKKWMKALNKYMVHGEEGLKIEEKDYLRSDVDPDGGYLTPPEYVKEIVKKRTEISPIRTIARVRTTNAKSSRLPIRTTLVTAGWVGEGETDSKSHSTYGMEEMPIDKLQVTVPITIEELQDAAFNMETEINQDIAEAFAKVEGAAFVKGDGVKKPQGFMVNPDVPFIISGVAADVTMDKIVALTGELKTGYTPVFGFTRRTLARIRTLKTTDGHYQWIIGNMIAGVPNTLAGYPYVEIPDMDEIGADKYPIIFGDFKRGYLIGDRAAMSVIRDDYTQKRLGMVEFTFMSRVGGQVILPEALVKMKCST